MSTATAFNYHRPFPFCPPMESPGDGIVGNLTLAQVMAFYWNLETFTLSFSGTTTEGANSFDFSQSMTAFPPSATIMDRARVRGGMFADSYSWSAFASLPSSARPPNERVCLTGPSYAPWLIGQIDFKNSTIASNSMSLYFAAGEDSINAGKFAISYTLSVLFTKEINPGTYIQVVFQQPGGGSGGTLFNSGVFTIAGVDFPWEFYHTTGATTTGGTVSATSSDYTY